MADIFINLEMNLLLFFICHGRILATPFNIITVMMETGPGYGPTIQGPALDVAYRHAKEMYPLALRNSTRHVIWKKNIITCSEAADQTPDVAMEIEVILRNFSGLSVIIVTGCSAEVQILGDYAREWNVPLVSTIGSDQALANNARYPTLLSFGPGSWVSRILALIRMLERNLLSTIDHTRYTVYVQRFSPPTRKKLETTLFTRLLQTSALKSRVIFLATDPAIVRRLMITAHQLNMTSGDYVYIAPVPTKVPPGGEMTWKYHETDDEIARVAFDSLIFVNNPNADWLHIKDLLSEMANRSAVGYNYTLNQDTIMNDLAVNAYETMACVTMVFNESFYADHAPDTTAFRSRFLNRAFQIPSRAVTMQGNGMRATDLVFSRLNVASGELEYSWRYVTVQDRLYHVSASSEQWHNGHTLPDDRPICGFQGEICARSDNSIRLLLPIILCLLLVCIFMPTTVIWIKWRYWYRSDYSTWWRIETEFLRTKTRFQSSKKVG